MSEDLKTTDSATGADSLDRIVLIIVEWENAKAKLAKETGDTLPTTMVDVAVLLKKQGVDVDSWPQGWGSNPEDLVRELFSANFRDDRQLPAASRPEINPDENSGELFGRSHCSLNFMKIHAIETLEKTKEIMPTWKNVLYPHGWVGHWGNMRNFAREIGYPYFAWNGRVFLTATGEDSGYYVDDIPSANAEVRHGTKDADLD
jgi:hypothetical protein